MKKYIYFLLFLTIIAFSQTIFANNDESKSTDDNQLTLLTPESSVNQFYSEMTNEKKYKNGAIQNAIKTLNLDDINVIIRKDRAETLAWQLFELLNHPQTLKLETINLKENKQTNSVRVHRVFGFDISLKKYNKQWKFDKETISTIPQLFKKYEESNNISINNHLPLEIKLQMMIPTSLKHQYFLMENWKWVAILLVICLGVILDWATARTLKKSLKKWIHKNNSNEIQNVDDKENRLRPLGLLAMAATWWMGIHLIGLPETGLMIIMVAVKAFASISAVWAAYRIVDIISAWLVSKAKETESKLDDILVPLIPRTLKIFITVVGILFIADNLNIDVSSLLAGLGLGGLAFALAAKDMVQNLFGSFTVLFDRTFSVGDWVIVDGHEGSIEKIGFRSTRIRTFYNSIISIPNSKFITAAVDNMGERQYRRYKQKFGIAYNTPPEKIEAFCEGIREIVRQHKYMRTDYFHIYLNDLADSSLEILIYIFWETPDWATELEARHNFLIDCLKLAKGLQVEYAFPTQTIHINNEDEVNLLKLDLSEPKKTGVDIANQIIKTRHEPK